MKNLPAILKINALKAAAGKKAKNHTSVEKSRIDFKATSEALLRLSGKSETRTIPAHCVIHDRPFSILYERQSINHRFQIVGIIIPDEQASKISVFKNFLKPQKQAEAITYKANDFDHSGKYCPHCGFKENFVQCTWCKQMVCGSRVRTLATGEQLFACSDSCGCTGKLSPCDYVKGIKAKSIQNFGINSNIFNLRIEKKTATKSLPKPKQKLIGYNGKPRLGFWKK